MRYMNSYDIQDAALHFADHPVLGPATQTLDNLHQWTNDNSDGWAYWAKPGRAAAKLMELIEGDGTSASLRDLSRATPAAYAAALQPIKAFRTRHGADFEIVAVAK